MRNLHHYINLLISGFNAPLPVAPQQQGAQGGYDPIQAPNSAANPAGLTSLNNYLQNQGFGQDITAAPAASAEASVMGAPPPLPNLNFDSGKLDCQMLSPVTIVVSTIVTHNI